MTGEFFNTYKRLLNNLDYEHHRYIFNDFNIENRLTGLTGPRGSGKTTLLLQYIKEKMSDPDMCIYASVDNIYFSKNLLIDFVRELYEYYGVKYFFLDEIHKYRNWNQELKNIYDSYPDIKVIFSGSSSINLVKGTYDLSRRAVLFHMNGMSFREYLLFSGIADIKPAGLEQILSDRGSIEPEIAQIEKLKGHFREYLGCGYYPFYLEDKNSYNQKILRVIDKTVFEDISSFYNLKTENLPTFKILLSYLATIPPSELNRNNISKNIGIDNKTTAHYLNILYETGLIEMISENRAGSSILKNRQKIYLENPDLYHAIGEETGFNVKTGTLREIFFIKMIENSGRKVFFTQRGDFEIDGNIFEIGGKNKTLKQIKDIKEKAYLIKDDILFGSKYEIPLYLFGFLY